jgi:hypothetical protein
VAWKFWILVENKIKQLNVLHWVKLLHTVIWAFFVGCILTIPIYGYAGDFFISGILIGIVMLEVFILAINKFRCPLSDIAARYTDDRKENFDIYIPIWLAKRNKQLFGGLFLVGLLYTLIKWVVSYNAT